VRGTRLKALGVTLGVALVGILIGFYVADYLVGNTPAFRPAVQGAAAAPVVNLTLQTVAAVGPQEAPNHPDWVSYLVRDEKGNWKRSTVFTLPANATIRVTIYNFDGASGLRNPYLARPQGMVGNKIQVDGKSVDAIDPNDASHTFAVPQLGIILAVPGVADDAKHPCGYAPCSVSKYDHRTIKFTFKTPAKSGTFRWQCFVPCAAGWIDGFGGPMQTIGYMDGYLNVKA
jgi:hypothetical protein